MSEDTGRARALNTAATDLRPGWDGPRKPFEDEAAETARKEAYWAWLDEAALTGPGGEFVADGVSGDAHWRRLMSADDADYEAREMRHSIGHGWGVYGGMGEVFSLRDAENAPQATVLVVGGVVVHAREHQNSRLSPESRAELGALAQARGWDIRPDKYRFEVMAEEAPEAVNTRITLLHRGAGGEKLFFSAVVSGRFTEEDAAAVHETFGPDELAAPLISAKDLPGGLLPPEAAGALEIVSLRHTAEAADAVSLDEVLEALRGPDGPSL